MRSKRKKKKDDPRTISLEEEKKRRLRQQRHDILLRKKKDISNRQFVPFMIKNLRRDVRDRFKAWCSLRGYNMTGLLRTFMYDCITGKYDPTQRKE